VWPAISEAGATPREAGTSRRASGRSRPSTGAPPRRWRPGVCASTSPASVERHRRCLPLQRNRGSEPDGRAGRVDVPRAAGDADARAALPSWSCETARAGRCEAKGREVGRIDGSRGGVPYGGKAPSPRFPGIPIGMPGVHRQRALRQWPPPRRSSPRRLPPAGYSAVSSRTLPRSSSTKTTRAGRRAQPSPPLAGRYGPAFAHSFLQILHTGVSLPLAISTGPPKSGQSHVCCQTMFASASSNVRRCGTWFTATPSAALVREHE
jgi:hypothetical protein